MSNQKVHPLLSRLYRFRLRNLPFNDFERRFREVEPHSMLGTRCLANIYNEVRKVVEQEIPGASVECGVARGGSAVLMGLALEDSGSDKDIVLFDSFEGLPEPSREGDPDYDKAKELVGECLGTYEDVEALLKRFGLRERTRMVKGFYQDTLPLEKPFPIAFLHLDCDWYESIKICLEKFYDQVSSEGVIQIDDYFTWEGCKKATDEFISERGLSLDIKKVDSSAIFFIKP